MTHTHARCALVALAFALGCHATEPNPQTVQGDCSTQIAAQRARHGASPLESGGGTGPDHWLRLEWTDGIWLYEWSDVAGTCRITKS